MRALDIAVENNYLAELYSPDKESLSSSVRRQNKPKVKPEHNLYGVTFSVADWIDQSGYDSTCGLASRALKPVD